MLTFDYFVLYFLIYSFLGWVWELFFLWFSEHRLHLRGIMWGPVLPIYGFSAIGMILLVRPYIHNPFLVFVGCVVVVTVMELCTGWFCHKVFHVMLWTYAKWPFNFHGYISLFSALGFGVLGLLLNYVIQPFFERHIDAIPVQTVKVVAPILATLFIIDFGYAVYTMIKTRMTTIEHKIGSFGALEDRYADKVQELSNAHPWRKFLSRLEYANLVQIRKAFPHAQITGRYADADQHGGPPGQPKAKEAVHAGAAHHGHSNGKASADASDKSTKSTQPTKTGTGGDKKS